MYPYQPRPWHVITISTPIFLIGSLCLTKGWSDLFGWIMIGLGFVSVGIIAHAHLWEKSIEELTAKRNLIDTARHLDLDRMAAIGLIVGEPKQTVKARITYEDRYGNFEREASMNDLPISPVILQTLANHLLNGVSFSRREWVEGRKLISDGDFRKLQDAFKTNGIIAPRDPNKPNLGYEFTSAGRAFLRSAASLPSPTPTMDMAQNDI